MTNGNDEAFGHAAMGDGGSGHCPGLTKREYFAAMAMKGILTSGETTPVDSWDCAMFAQIVGRDAVKYADALITELNKTEAN